MLVVKTGLSKHVSTQGQLAAAMHVAGGGRADFDHGKVQVWARTVLICLQELIDALQATAAAHLHSNVMR